MCRFIESILFENGEMPLLQEHEIRFRSTQLKAFGKIVHPALERIISKEKISPKKDIVYKCRVVYNAESTEVSFIPYQKKIITHLFIKTDDTIDYSLKYENRSALSTLSEGLDTGGEILIVKKGFLTDTSFTNIALSDGMQWFTPDTPLLHGVQRNFLLKNKIISEKRILLKEVLHFSKIRLFNALVNWENAWEFDTKEIIFPHI